MWTETTREKYERGNSRYASDLRDGEWALSEPFLPLPGSIRRPRTTDLREVVNALLYMAATGCQWRMLLKEFPPYSTVQGYSSGPSIRRGGITKAGNGEACLDRGGLELSHGGQGLALPAEPPGRTA